MSHSVVKCSECKTVIKQCRCPKSSEHPVEWSTCPACLRKEATRAAYLSNWVEAARSLSKGENIRVSIWKLQEKMQGMEQADEPEVDHDFFDDDEGNHYYGRTIHMPRGYLVIGKLHRHGHDNFLTKGRCLVVTEFDGVKEIVGPCAFDSIAGTKRVVFCLEDTEWTTLHDNPDNVKSIAEIEPYVIAMSYGELGMTEPKQLYEEAINELVHDSNQLRGEQCLSDRSRNISGDLSRLGSSGCEASPQGGV